jgi:hypothetical protein
MIIQLESTAALSHFPDETAGRGFCKATIQASKKSSSTGDSEHLQVRNFTAPRRIRAHLPSVI